MVFWLLAGLGVYLLNIFLPAILYLPAEGLVTHAGSRDQQPPVGPFVGRARRSLANLQENLPIFLGLGILALVVPGADIEQAILGAQIFVFARIAYIPLYLASIPYTRSMSYLAGLYGTLLMLLALV